MGNSVDTVKAAESITNDLSLSAGGIQPAAVAKKPACKACCACPETKKVRDAW